MAHTNVEPAEKISAAVRRERERFLLEVTSLPTASGHEDAVMELVERWVARRRARLTLTRDGVGNLLVSQRGFKAAAAKKAPVFITAHLDHPAFLVLSAAGDRLELEFRGSVLEQYFRGAELDVFSPDLKRSFRAKVVSFDPKGKPFKKAAARLARPSDAARIKPGCIARWSFPKASVSKDIVRTHACDDLAAVAAALSAFDGISRDRCLAHVALFFTRAEEVGFVGAIGAARGGVFPDGARLVCLECSRSFPHDSPIGGGPIVRVGDRMSVFSPELTNAVSDIAAAHAQAVPGFRYQRKLMPGGACEATAFAAYGISSTCLCLPLGNYHNMADIDGVIAGAGKARVAQETVSAGDFHGLVELLRVIARDLDGAGTSHRGSMEKIWAERGNILPQRRAAGPGRKGLAGFGVEI